MIFPAGLQFNGEDAGFMVINPKRFLALRYGRKLLAAAGPGKPIAHRHVEGDANLFEVGINIGGSIFGHEPDDDRPAGFTF